MSITIWHTICVIAVCIEFLLNLKKSIRMIQNTWNTWFVRGFTSNQLGKRFVDNSPSIPKITLSSHIIGTNVNVSPTRYLSHLQLNVPIAVRNTKRIPLRRAITTIASNLLTHVRGAGCSKNGLAYEREVHSVTSACLWKKTNERLNQQRMDQLGGSSSKHDLVCNWNRMSIPIEIKKSKAPDWGQFALMYDDDTCTWYVPNEQKAPVRTKINQKLAEFQNQQPLFQGRVPSFVSKDITHADWKLEKACFDNVYKDVYFPCDTTIISQLYQEKNCYYMQVSDGHGLFHTGTDICSFGVPFFACDQRIRIRIKVHTRSNSKGFCKLSVMLSIQPVNNKQIPYSPHSFDDLDKIPHNLRFDS